jgi:ubiquinone/menaquinone biosynthesis C-methylase UbiE
MKKVRSNVDILSHLGSFDGKIVVDVGCGTGELVRDLAEQGAGAIGIDTENMIREAEKAKRIENETYVSGTAEKLPLNDELADIITFFASLHHVPIDLMGRALEEAERVLKPGGLIFCVEPVGEEGSYYELVRLTGDERDIQAVAYQIINQAMSFNLVLREEYRIYFERSHEDYLKLNEVYVEDPDRRNQLAKKAGDITRRLSREAGMNFNDFRYQSICRVNILAKG